MEEEEEEEGREGGSALRVGRSLHQSWALGGAVMDQKSPPRVSPHPAGPKGARTLITSGNCFILFPQGP